MALNYSTIVCGCVSGRVNAKSLSRRSAKKAMGRQQRRSQVICLPIFPLSVLFLFRSLISLSLSLTSYLSHANNIVMHVLKLNIWLPFRLGPNIMSQSALIV